MPVYDFNFPREAAGLVVSVVDLDGTEVDSGTLPGSADSGGQVTHSSTLTAGTYLGIVADSSLQRWNRPSPLVVRGALDVAASLDGGVHQDVTWTSIGYQAGTQQIPDDGTPQLIAFDTLPVGVTEEAPGIYNIGQGVFLVRYDIEPSQPAEDRSASVAISFGDDPLALTGVAIYPIPLSSTASSYAGYLISGEVVITGPLVSVSILAKSDAGSGAALNLDFASISIKRVV